LGLLKMKELTIRATAAAAPMGAKTANPFRFGILEPVFRLISIPSDRARAINLAVIPEGIWRFCLSAASAESP